MALSVPSTQTVSDNIVAAIEGTIGKSIPLLPKSFTRVLAKSLAGVFVLSYKYSAWSLLQQFAAHASFRETTVNGRTLTPLIEWGRLVGVGDPAIATNARMNVQFTVLTTDSSTVAAGTQLVHPGSGVVYITLAAVTLDASPKTVEVLAASDPDGNAGSGLAGNRDDGDVLKWANPIPQLSTLGASVIATTYTAEEGETESAYRDRILDRFGARPQGGAYADYAVWGTEASGVINIYPYTGDPGVVDVYVEASEETSSDGRGTPTAAQLYEVQTLIEYDSSGLATRRPIGAFVNVLEITREPFDVTVNGLDASDAAAVTAAEVAIDAALTDYFYSREPFIQGLSRLPRTDRVTASSVAGVVDEAASALGATVTTVLLEQGSSPITAYTLGHGEKAELGTVTFP